MIPADCIPKTKNEKVVEILSEPDKSGKSHFALYWWAPDHHTGPSYRGQHFRAKLEDFSAGVRIVHRKG